MTDTRRPENHATIFYDSHPQATSAPVSEPGGLPPGPPSPGAPGESAPTNKPISAVNTSANSAIQTQRLEVHLRRAPHPPEGQLQGEDVDRVGVPQGAGGLLPQELLASCPSFPLSRSLVTRPVFKREGGGSSRQGQVSVLGSVLRAQGLSPITG